MKKSIILLLLAFCFLVFLFPVQNVFADFNAQITFAWDDDNVKTPGYAWHLFMHKEGEVYNYAAPAVIFTWTEGQTSYQGGHDFTFSGPANQQETVYFVLRAVAADGATSSDSNEVTYSFKYPINGPFNLTINVQITSN